MTDRLVVVSSACSQCAISALIRDYLSITFAPGTTLYCHILTRASVAVMVVTVTRFLWRKEHGNCVSMIGFHLTSNVQKMHLALRRCESLLIVPT